MRIAHSKSWICIEADRDVNESWDQNVPEPSGVITNVDLGLVHRLLSIKRHRLTFLFTVVVLVSLLV